jgi:hypothetical protein
MPCAGTLAAEGFRRQRLRFGDRGDVGSAYKARLHRQNNNPTGTAIAGGTVAIDESNVVG